MVAMIDCSRRAEADFDWSGFAWLRGSMARLIFNVVKFHYLPYAYASDALVKPSSAIQTPSPSACYALPSQKRPDICRL